MDRLPKNDVKLWSRAAEILRELPEAQVGVGTSPITAAQAATQADRHAEELEAKCAWCGLFGLYHALARNLSDALPNVSFIGFTGTPIEQSDANTRAVFGEYISVYKLQHPPRGGPKLSPLQIAKS